MFRLRFCLCSSYVLSAVPSTLQLYFVEHVLAMFRLCSVEKSDRHSPFIPRETHVMNRSHWVHVNKCDHYDSSLQSGFDASMQL